MTRLSIETLDQQVAFRPGDPIDGLLTWEFTDEPRDIEIRLIWHTSGKGNRDTAVVAVAEYPNPTPADVQPFSFIAPDGPHSFSGKLITISWVLEAVVRKDKKLSARVGLTIAPEATEIRPQSVADRDEGQAEWMP